MSDETKDSAPEQVSEEKPTPTFTDTSSGQQNSAFDLDAIAQKVAEKLSPTIEKTVQSVKDKRFAKVDKALEGLGLLDDLREQGVNIPENIELKLRLAALEGKSANSVSAKTETAPAAPNVSQIISETIELAGLDAKDPRVVEWMRGQYRNPDHMVAEGFRLSKRLATSPKPDVSTSASPKAQPAATQTVESLTEEYRKSQIAARGKRDAILANKQKYREMGVDVDNVIFS